MELAEVEQVVETGKAALNQVVQGVASVFVRPGAL